MMISPVSIPMMMAAAGALERHIRMDSGRSSPKTTYSMAPEAKLRESLSAAKSGGLTRAEILAIVNEAVENDV